MPHIHNNNVISLSIKRKIKSIESSATEERSLITIYSNAGEKIAKIEAPVLNASEWTMTTSSDGKKTEFSYKLDDETEELIKWLIDKKYLVI